MYILRIVLFFILFVAVCCRKQHSSLQDVQRENGISTDSILLDSRSGNGPLLLTTFKSFDELKSVVKISYIKDAAVSASVEGGTEVQLYYQSGSGSVTSSLKQGVDENSFNTARKGNVWQKMQLLLASPYAVINKDDLQRIEILSRRRDHLFGEGDVAFYDLAETMVFHITDEDVMTSSAADFSEKGYLNTFNHVIAQAFMTTLFSETLADFVADAHERTRLPELVSGEFDSLVVNDLENGPVDNYLDMVNNEFGQELGKSLKKKYAITNKSHWTPELVANYLNDIQSYHSWVFGVGFKPFKPTEKVISRFADKINAVRFNFSKLKAQ